MPLSVGSAAQQLAEFLARIAPATTAQDGLTHAIEGIAEAFEAEVTALVSEEHVACALGIDPVAARAQLVAAASDRRGILCVEGLGDVPFVSVPVDPDAGSALVVCRVDDPISTEETSLLRGMARVLALALRMIATIERESALLASLRQRQTFVESLSVIERSISGGRPLQQTLDAITEAASELFGDEVIGLRLLDRDDPSTVVLVSAVGVDPDVYDAIRRSPIDVGVGARAIREGRLVVQHDYGRAAGVVAALAERGLQAAMAAPVHTDGRVAGSLVVASHRPGRHYAAAEQEMLVSFAEHVSLALNDALARERLDRALDDATQRALHDVLTGLPNRMLLRDRIEQALARAERSGRGVAVAFVDLDDFKLVNDMLGHASGDELLRGVADRLRTALRPGDTAARLGGDEFAVVLTDVDDEEDVVAVAERLLPAVAEPFVISGVDVMTTGSIGIAFAEPHERLSPGELLRRADVAMYEAKSTGKNRAALYVHAMHLAVSDRAGLVADLRSALAARQLHVAYQPIVSLQTGAVIGAEALVRWAHPVRGLVSPAVFVPLAEECGLVESIGGFVLESAAAQVHSWQERGLIDPTFTLHVNLSPRQLLQRNAVQDVLAVLARTGLAPARVTLEITESLLLHDDDLTRGRLQQLRAHGMRIAVDDFGTGYSSLAYLCRFPIDVLKIDRAFVRNLDSASSERSLVAAVVHLAASLALDTVAEGVETPAQLAVLRSLGCNHGQGFHFGAPVGPEAFPAMLDRPAGTPVPG